MPVVRGSTLERALHGGEDYELLVHRPEKSAARGIIRIGRVVRGAAGTVRTFKGACCSRAGMITFMTNPEPILDSD